VQILRTTIASALERLRLESDSLQREEAALRAHEERVVASFDRLRQKEVSYKERGKKISSYLVIFRWPSDEFFLSLTSASRRRRK
jgi:hypothetical protein